MERRFGQRVNFAAAAARLAEQFEQWGGLMKRYLVIGLALLAVLVTCAVYTRSYAVAGTVPDTQQPVQVVNNECLSCHGHPGLVNSKGTSIYVNPTMYIGSVHGQLSCTACHGSNDYTTFPHKNLTYGTAFALPIMGKCTQCHARQSKEFYSSVHGKALMNGKPNAPTCVSCHSPIHGITPSTSMTSSVYITNIPKTCGQSGCHQPYVLSSYLSSFHGTGLSNGDLSMPECVDCHGAHAIASVNNPASLVASQHRSSTCGTCHRHSGNKLIYGVYHIPPKPTSSILFITVVAAIYRWLILLVVGVLSVMAIFRIVRVLKTAGRNRSGVSRT